jgi:hypothetical protein
MAGRETGRGLFSHPIRSVARAHLFILVHPHLKYSLSGWHNAREISNSCWCKESDGAAQFATHGDTLGVAPQSKM